MMKRWIVILIALGLLVSASACSKGQGVGPISATPTVAELPVETPSQFPPMPTVAESPVETPSQFPPTPTPAPTPDFASMNFVEKNNLYLELLAGRQTAGMDTTPAEEAYAQSLNAMFDGDTAQADQYLQQAILLLWNP